MANCTDPFCFWDLTNIQAFKINLYLYIAFTIFGYSCTLIHKTYGSIDTLWTVVPLIHAWVCFAYAPDNYRILLMCILITMWGLRLSYRAYFHGIFDLKEEDYRWTALRNQILEKDCGRFLEFLFSFFYVNVYEYFELWCFTWPALLLTNSEVKSINYLYDLPILAVWLTLFFGEWIADVQQQGFQTDPVKKQKFGFLQEGLFSISRHPNFFCEISMWMVLPFFAWPVIEISWAAFLLSFIGGVQVLITINLSTDVTEKRTGSKYPDYAEYQKRVSRLIPFLNCC